MNDTSKTSYSNINLNAAYIAAVFAQIDNDSAETRQAVEDAIAAVVADAESKKD